MACVQSQGKRLKIQIWDTAGQERFRSISTKFYQSACGALLVFDVTNRASFQHLGYWLTTFRSSLFHLSTLICVARREALLHNVVLLVGNKKDLDAKRQVSAQHIGFFFECGIRCTGVARGSHFLGPGAWLGLR